MGWLTKKSDKGKGYIYLLNTAIYVLKNYRTDVSKYQIFDLLVKKIRYDENSIAGWSRYMSDSISKICQGPTMDTQKKILEDCILNEIEKCSFSQEFLPDSHTRDDVEKIAKVYEVKEIDQFIQDQIERYVLSQVTLYVFEAIAIVEYDEIDTEWAFLFTYLYDKRLQNIIDVALQDNVEIKSIHAHYAQEFENIRLEFHRAISEGVGVKINHNEIDIYKSDYENTRGSRPSVFHCSIIN